MIMIVMDFGESLDSLLLMIKKMEEIAWVKKE